MSFIRRGRAFRLFQYSKQEKHLIEFPRCTRRVVSFRVIEVQDLTPVMTDDEKQYRTPNVSVGTVKKSIAAMASRWFLRNVSQRFMGSGSLGARRMHRETLRSENIETQLEQFTVNARLWLANGYAGPILSVIAPRK